MKYTTARINPEDVSAIEFMIKQFQQKNPEVTRQSFITWCVRNTVQELFNALEIEKKRLATEGSTDLVPDATPELASHNPLSARISQELSQQPTPA